MRTLIRCFMLCFVMALLTACDTSQATATASIVASAIPTHSVTGILTDTVTDSATETPASVEQATPTTFVYPQAVSNGNDPCGIGLSTRLILHERGRVADEDDRPLNMREGPDVDFAQIQQLAVNSVFLVLEGPECTDDYIWYYIRYDGTEGWIAEGEQDIHYVEPYFPG